MPIYSLILRIYNPSFRTEPTESSTNSIKNKTRRRKRRSKKMQPETSDQMLYSFLTGNEISGGGFSVSGDYMSTMQSLCGSSSSTSSYYPLAISGIGETVAQDRALAALRNHKEAERRRRERINSHLNKLRNVFSCNSKVL